MASVSFEESVIWNFGLPPYLPGAASNLGAVLGTPTAANWTVNWVGPNSLALDMQVSLTGSGLSGPADANLPSAGTITGFTLFVEGSLTLFEIAGLSIDAADFAAAVASNQMSELLLSGDDSFAAIPGGSIFADGLRLRGHGGNDMMNLGGVQSFTGFELLGDDGDDTLVGSNEVFTSDTLYGGNDDDVLSGLAGNDLLFGDAGEDRLFGGAGNDTLSGGLGRDMLRGDEGDDVIVVTLDSQPEGEILDGGGVAAGERDLLSLGGDISAPPQIIDLTASQVTRFERLELFGADVLMTVAQYEEFTRYGLYVSFELFGPVTVRFADAGFINLADRAWFGSASNGGVVRVTGSAGDDTIIGRGNADVAGGGAPAGTTPIGTADRIDGGGGNDRLFGAGGSDTLLGNTGNDTLRGEAGNDSLEGGDGNDVLAGGTGADALVGGTGLDTASYESASAGVRVQIGVSSGNTGDAFGDTFFSIENLRGSTQGDWLAGNGVANLLEGLAGSDSLFGGNGNDTLRGGAGADTLRGSAGIDVLEGGADGDTFQFTAFADSAPATPDQILDFVSGSDRINVAPVIAGAFAYNGNGAFSGGGIASVIWSAPGSGFTDVLFDDGSGGAAEMVIRLTGNLTLAAGDFVL